MEDNLTPYDDRHCPVYGKIIDGELCYETAMCLKGIFKISSVPETKNIKMSLDIATKLCQKCKHTIV